MSRRRLAFTLIETLSVAVIVAVLASILFPVAQSSILASRRSSAVERLHQLHLGLMLYRADHDGDGRYGTAEEMGLPSYGQLLQNAAIAALPDRQMWSSPCGTHPDRIELFRKSGSPEDSIDYVYYPEGGLWDPDDQMRKYFQTQREDAVILNDTNCFDHSLPLFDGLRSRTIIGVHMDGHVETRQTWDYVDSWTNWTKK